MNPNHLSIEIPGGGYEKGDTFLHRKGVEIKVGGTVVLLTAIALGQGIHLMGIGIICLVGFRLAGLSLVSVAGHLKGVLWFLFLIAVFQVAFTPGDPVKVNDWSLGVSWQGVDAAILAVGRLLLMFWVSMILLRTTSPTALMAAAEFFAIRWPGIGRHLQQPVTIGILALQMIPGIVVELDHWIQSTLSDRQESLEKGILNKIKQVSGWIVPWVVSIVLRREQFLGSATKFQDSSYSGRPET